MILKKAYFSYDAMKQALSGEDKRVLYEMYVPCHNDLMLYCLGKFNDVELAKDAASETIQKLLEHPSPSDIENLRAWLLTVAKKCVPWNFEQTETPLWHLGECISFFCAKAKS